MHPQDRHPLLDPNISRSDPALQRAADEAQGAAQILGDEYVAQRLRDAERDSGAPWALTDAAGALAAEAAAASGRGGPSAATAKAMARLYATTHPEQQQPIAPTPTLEPIPDPGGPPAFTPPLGLLQSSMLDDPDIRAVNDSEGSLKVDLFESLAAPQRDAMEQYVAAFSSSDDDVPVADVVNNLGVYVRAVETLGQVKDPISIGFRKFVLYDTGIAIAIVGAMHHQLRLASAGCDWLLSTLQTEGWHEPASSVPLSELYAFCQEMSAMVPPAPDPGTGNEARRMYGIEPSQRSSTQEPQPTSPAAEVVAQWAPDPHGRFKLRYWDGSQWTAHVSDGSATSVDPLP